MPQQECSWPPGERVCEVSGQESPVVQLSLTDISRVCGGSEQVPWSKTAWVQILVLLVNGCVTLSRLPSFSHSVLFFVKWG